MVVEARGRDGASVTPRIRLVLKLGLRYSALLRTNIFRAISSNPQRDWS